MISVEDGARQGAAGYRGVLAGTVDMPGAHVVGDRPADHPAAELGPARS
ncbi:hypothetical protein ABT115_05650 [Streptomyces sp. NPDC001832]